MWKVYDRPIDDQRMTDNTWSQLCTGAFASGVLKTKSSVLRVHKPTLTFGPTFILFMAFLIENNSMLHPQTPNIFQWPLPLKDDLKFNKVYPLTIGTICAKLDENILIQQLHLYCVHKVIKPFTYCDLDLWPTKLIKFILSSWTTFVPNFIKIQWTIFKFVYCDITL